MSHESLERDEVVTGSSDRTLGLTFAAVFLVIALWPLVSGHAIRWWSVIVSALFALVALAMPSILGPLNKVWLRLGLLLHKVTSPIVLGIMFFVVVTPAGLLARLLGKDLLRLRLDQGAATYWIERQPPGPKPDTLPNQF